MHYNDLHPTVGLLSVACTSNNTSVGGVFNIDINSPGPPSDLIVYLVRVSLETTIELRTKRKGRQTVPVQRHKLFEKGWVPPRPSDPNGPGDGRKSDGFIRDAGSDSAWTIQAVARIPDDNSIRASTMPGSRAAIRMSHTFVVEVIHSRQPPADAPATPPQERRLKVFALRQPVVIPSCCCAYDAVILPAYTPEDNSTRPANMPSNVGMQRVGTPGTPRTLPPDTPWANTNIPIHGPGHDHCVCGELSWTQMISCPRFRAYIDPFPCSSPLRCLLACASPSNQACH